MFELVQGIGDKNIIEDIIKRNGVTPYHSCYSVFDLAYATEFLIKNGYRPITSTIRAIAFDNLLIQFFYNSSTGIIELLEMKD